jgi:hypothetical protein
MTLTPTVIRECDIQVPTDVDTAMFGLGCFWGPDAAFGALDGLESVVDFFANALGQFCGCLPNEGDRDDVLRRERRILGQNSHVSLG